MITVITGVPGTGKTAYAVSELLKEVETGRPIYVWGIKELTVPHLPCPPVAEWTTLVPHENDPGVLVPTFTFPPGSLVIVDEAQDVYRPRASTAKVPPHAAALERHRHLGLDIWLLTQKPMLLDSHVRNEAGRHIHLHATWKGRQLLEWPTVVNPNESAEREKAVRKPYKLPQHVFGLYKSAEVHTRVKRRLPGAAYALALLAVGVPLGGLWIYGRIQDRIHGDDAKAAPVPALPQGQKDPQAAPVPKPVRWALESSMYVKVGPQVLRREWRARSSTGEERVLKGRDCEGEGMAARCRDVSGIRRPAWGGLQ